MLLPTIAALRPRRCRETASFGPLLARLPWIETGGTGRQIAGRGEQRFRIRALRVCTGNAAPYVGSGPPIPPRPLQRPPRRERPAGPQNRRASTASWTQLNLSPPVNRARKKPRRWANGGRRRGVESAGLIAIRRPRSIDAYPLPARDGRAASSAGLDPSAEALPRPPYPAVALQLTRSEPERPLFHSKRRRPRSSRRLGEGSDRAPWGQASMSSSPACDDAQSARRLPTRNPPSR